MDSNGIPIPSKDHPSAPSWSVTMIRTPEPPPAAPPEQPRHISTASSSTTTKPAFVPRGWSRFVLFALVAAGVIFLILLLTRHRTTPE